MGGEWVGAALADCPSPSSHSAQSDQDPSLPFDTKTALLAFGRSLYQAGARSHRPACAPGAPVKRAAGPSGESRRVYVVCPDDKTAREAKAVLELARAGFVAFNPTELVSMRASRIVKFKRQERERALLTGLVLVGFPGVLGKRRRGNVVVSSLHAEVPWLRVLSQTNVVGVVGMATGPVPVPLAKVMAVRLQHRQKGSTRNWNAAVGDMVEVMWGAWSGKQGEIVGLVDGAAKLKLFGVTGLLENLVQPLSVPEPLVRGIA